MQKTKFSETKRAYDNTLSTLKDLTKNKKIPPKLLAALKEVKKEFEDYEINLHKEELKKLNGEVMTAQYALEAVIEATGYTRWKLENNPEEDNQVIIDYLKETYGIDIEKSKFKEHKIYRDVNSRNDFWLVNIYAFEGHCWFSMDTGRADAVIDNIITNDELVKEIKKIFDNN